MNEISCFEFKSIEFSDILKIFNELILKKKIMKINYGLKFFVFFIKKN